MAKKYLYFRIFFDAFKHVDVCDKMSFLDTSEIILAGDVGRYTRSLIHHQRAITHTERNFLALCF